MAPTVTLACRPVGQDQADPAAQCQPRSVGLDLRHRDLVRVSRPIEPGHVQVEHWPRWWPGRYRGDVGRPAADLRLPLARPLTVRTPGSRDTALASTGEIPPPLGPPPKPPAEIAMSPVKESLTPLTPRPSAATRRTR